MSAEIIKFDNLTNEMKYAFHAGDFRRAELLASELHILTVNARQIQELITNNKKATDCAVA